MRKKDSGPNPNGAQRRITGSQGLQKGASRAGTGKERGSGGPSLPTGVVVREKKEVALIPPAGPSRAAPGAGSFAFGSGTKGERSLEEEVVRVLLVEDHAIFRQLFASAFEAEPGFEVVGQAGSVAGAREVLSDLQGEGGVDVAVLDLRLPDGEGPDLIGRLREGNPYGAALVLTASLDLGTYGRAVAAGAAGVLHKSVSIGEVMDAIRRLAAGEALLSQEEAVRLLRVADRERARAREARAAFERLTERERDVLLGLAEGLGDKEIAGRLGVRPGTARRYAADMLQKLGAHSRLQALVLAARHGFVRIGPEEAP